VATFFFSLFFGKDLWYCGFPFYYYLQGGFCLSFFVIFAAVAIFTAASAHSRPLLFFHRVPSYIAWTILAVGVIEHVDNREDTHRIF
jgi:hypothetical protein